MRSIVERRAAIEANLTRARDADVVRTDDPRVILEEDTPSSRRALRIVSQADDTGPPGWDRSAA
jgi:hypothetical protein